MPRDNLAVLRVRAHGWGVYSFAFSPDGSRMASGSGDGTVRLWDAANGKELAVLLGHVEQVRSLAFSSDGSRIASRSEVGLVRLWDASNGQELAVLLGHHISSVALSPDGSRIATASRDKTVRLWDASSGEQLHVLRGHESRIYSVVFSPNGSRIASGSEMTVRLWDASSGDELHVLRGHESRIYSVVFSPNGLRIASGSWDKTVRMWDASTGEELAVLRGHRSDVYSVAFSPNGSRIASGSGDGTARLWDVATGRELLVLRGHAGRVSSLAFSPDGSRIVTGSQDRTTRVWDATSGDELIVLRGLEQTVSSLAFSPDGSRIASASWGDETVRLWDTVAYRDRIAERDEARRDSETIRPFVDELFSKGLDCTAVALEVRSGDLLRAPLRRAAINLVLKRCSELREQARRQTGKAVDQALTYVEEGLYEDAEPLLIDALDIVRRRLAPDSLETITLIMSLADVHERQGRVDEAQRYGAELASFRQRLADRRNSYAWGLNGRAWRVVDEPSSDLPELRYALLEAMLAGELVDQNDVDLSAPIFDTLALAYHRTGHTAKAIETQKKTLAVMRAGSEYKNAYEDRLATFEKALKDARQEQPPE